MYSRCTSISGKGLVIETGSRLVRSEPEVDRWQVAAIKCTGVELLAWEVTTLSCFFIPLFDERYTNRSLTKAHHVVSKC